MKKLLDKTKKFFQRIGSILAGLPANPPILRPIPVVARRDPRQR